MKKAPKAERQAALAEAIDLRVDVLEGEAGDGGYRAPEEMGLGSPPWSVLLAHVGEHCGPLVREP